MHDSPQDDVVIVGALPGVWRGQPRLYLDESSSIEVESELELTRMGMLRTKANVQGVVLSCSKRDGKRSDGRPWSMLSFHLWDGERVAEVVAFGSAINGTLSRLSQDVKLRSHLQSWVGEKDWFNLGLILEQPESKSNRRLE